MSEHLPDPHDVAVDDDYPAYARGQVSKEPRGPTVSELEMRLSAAGRQDIVVLVKKDAEYGSSWKRRGGVGAWMMALRKIDRLETFLCDDGPAGYDIFRAAQVDNRPEGVLDDLRDLRRYLLLIDSEISARATP